MQSQNYHNTSLKRGIGTRLSKATVILLHSTFRHYSNIVMSCKVGMSYGSYAGKSHVWAEY